MKKNKIIIGSKPLMNYIAAIVFEFEMGDEAVLSAVGSNVDKLERLVRIFTSLSKRPILDNKRSTEKVGDMQAVVCSLVRKR